MENRRIKTKLIGKEEVFNALALGEALQLPVLLLGEPGTGKTQALLDYAASKYNYDRNAVRNNTFVIELDEGTKTSEIKGRVNMKSLLENKEYKIDAPIADAEFVMINEVDKGNSAIRNTMLSIMREKAIFYGDEVKKCKWQSFVGSCNQINGSEEDNPFWDRFVLTLNVDRVGFDTIFKTFKGTITELEISIPTDKDIKDMTEKVDIHKTKRFIKAVYDKISDRTASYIPKMVDAIKLIYGLDDLESIMKCCSLIAPDRVSVVASKLESTRENSVRTQIQNFEGVYKGGDNVYTKLYLKQLCDELKEMHSIGNHKKKAQELQSDLHDHISNLDFSYEDHDLQASFVKMVEDCHLNVMSQIDSEDEV